MKLRSAVIRLAADNPALRPHLLPLLTSPAAVGNPVVPVQQVVQAPAQPIIVQSPPAQAPVIVMQQMGQPGQQVSVGTPAPVYTSMPPVAALDEGEGVFVTEATQQGFNKEFEPELTRMLQLGMTREQVANWAKTRLREGFKSKDSLYMILIRYQSTFESEVAYRLSLERAVDIWKVQGGTSAPIGG